MEPSLMMGSMGTAVGEKRTRLFEYATTQRLPVVGFVGARVIEQTTKKTLPKGFQTSEFVQEHGFVDENVPRSAQRQQLARLLRLHESGEIQ